MTERESDILRSLRFIKSRPDQATLRDGYVRCMDVGGTDASHHSGTLRSMEKRGWVESRRVGGRRGYRITEAGLGLLAAPGHPTEEET